MTKHEILNMLESFTNERPGLIFADYGDVRMYREDYRKHCEKPLRDFRELLAAVRWRDSLTAEDIRDALRGAFGSRIELRENEKRIDYTPGQYGATEYRHAACDVLARALWAYWREHTPESMTPREYITKNARREFGRGMTARYFD